MENTEEQQQDTFSWGCLGAVIVITLAVIILAKYSMTVREWIASVYIWYLKLVYPMTP